MKKAATDTITFCRVCTAAIRGLWVPRLRKTCEFEVPVMTVLFGIRNNLFVFCTEREIVEYFAMN